MNNNPVNVIVLTDSSVNPMTVSEGIPENSFHENFIYSYPKNQQPFSQKVEEPKKHHEIIC